MCRRLKKFASLTLKMFLKNAVFSPIKVSKLTSVQMHLIWLLSFCWAKDWNFAYYVSAGPLSPIPTPKLTSTAWTWRPHRVWKKQAWGKGCSFLSSSWGTISSPRPSLSAHDMSSPGPASAILFPGMPAWVGRSPCWMSPTDLRENLCTGPSTLFQAL